MEELKARFAELKPRYYPSRQRFTLPPREGARSGEALADGRRLVADYGLADGSVLYFKDLGPQVGAGRGGRARCCLLPGGRSLAAAADVCCPGNDVPDRPPSPPASSPLRRRPWQIGYAAVFFWEYLGPLLVYPAFYLLPHLLYPGLK